VLTVLFVVLVALLWRAMEDTKASGAPAVAPKEVPPTFGEWLEGITEYEGPACLIVSGDTQGRLLLTFEQVDGLLPRALTVTNDRILLRYLGQVLIGRLWFWFDEQSCLLHLEFDGFDGRAFRRTYVYDPSATNRVRAIGSCCDCPTNCYHGEDLWCCPIGEAAVCACNGDDCVQMCRAEFPGGAEPIDP